MSWNNPHSKERHEQQNRQIASIAIIAGVIVLFGLGIVYMFMQGSSTKNESAVTATTPPQDTTGRVCLYSKDFNVISWKSSRFRGISNSGSAFFTDADTGNNFDILAADGFLITTDAHECPNLKGKVSP